jgi:hypothetical protein
MKYINSKTKIGLVGILLLAITIPAAFSISNGQGSSNAVTSSQQTNTQGLPGLVCFKYNTYGDTWILSFLQTGPSEFQVSGYNPAYPSSMTGGGAIVSGQLLLSLDERLPGYVETGQHNVDIDMATSPYIGTDYPAFFDINGTKIVSYPAGLALTEIACPAGTQPTVVIQKTAAVK